MTRHLTAVDSSRSRNARERELVEEIEESVRSHPAGKGVDEKEFALLEAEKWSIRLEIAREAQNRLLVECYDLGIPNTVVANRLGKTEAAIRMFHSRRLRRAKR